MYGDMHGDAYERKKKEKIEKKMGMEGFEPSLMFLSMKLLSHL